MRVRKKKGAEKVPTPLGEDSSVLSSSLSKDKHCRVGTLKALSKGGVGLLFPKALANIL